MPEKTKRRDFLKNTTTAGVGFWVATRSAFAQSRSPNERIHVASIGVGGMGSGDVDGTAGAGGTIVALCDVREDALNGKAQGHPKAKKYTDFRKMFDEMHKDFDAVTVSTPDHTHAVATMMAMKHGKAVYTQKPLTRDVYEARVLTEYATKNKIVTQMGNQGTAESGLREAVEVIWSGAIGPVREVHVWTNRPVWPQGVGAILAHKGVSAAMTGHGGMEKPPSSLHWDLWLGTAPERPYDPIYQPFNWRGWWDYGTGALGDMACHTANMAFMACKLGYPVSVEAQMSEYNDQTFPMWSVVEYQFPEREGLPPLKWTWYDGGSDKPAWVNRKLRELAHGHPIPGSGSLIIGDKGTLFSPDDYGSSYRLLPASDFEGYQPPARQLPRSPGHRQEWIQGIREGKPELCMANFGYAGPLTETVVLGCIALRRGGKRLRWDGPNMKFTNDDEANQWLKRDYRGSWTL